MFTLYQYIQFIHQICLKSKLVLFACYTTGVCCVHGQRKYNASDERDPEREEPKPTHLRMLGTLP